MSQVFQGIIVKVPEVFNQDTWMVQKALVMKQKKAREYPNRKEEVAAQFL